LPDLTLSKHQNKEIQ